MLPDIRQQMEARSRWPWEVPGSPGRGVPPASPLGAERRLRRELSLQGEKQKSVKGAARTSCFQRERASPLGPPTSLFCRELRVCLTSPESGQWKPAVFQKEPGRQKDGPVCLRRKESPLGRSPESTAAYSPWALVGPGFPGERDISKEDRSQGSRESTAGGTECVWGGENRGSRPGPGGGEGRAVQPPGESAI